MGFFDTMKKTLDKSELNRSVTENGGVGYKTTGKALLDLNFAVSSLRDAKETEIEVKFAEALAENPALAIVWLFFARDVRGGMGERRLFRVCMAYISANFPEIAKKLLKLIPEYGRWDDVVVLTDVYGVKKAVNKLVTNQFLEDVRNMYAGKPISLLAKWLPSENASSITTKQYASKIRQALGFTPKQYRKSLSSMRKYIDVVERKMSANKWGDIKYEAVPSRANLIYNSAFLAHDETRRREFLEKLKDGETKINASVLFPHDIVHHMEKGVSDKETLEALWKALPNTVENGQETIVVADGSGSMCSRIGGTGVTALQVANALAIYFAERLPGQFHDKYITFSHRPQLVDLSGAATLKGKLNIASRHNECSNTNIEAVFDLILDTAVHNHLKQDELPKNILVISDMEFDACAETGTTDIYDPGFGYTWTRYKKPDKPLFRMIQRNYEAAGYKVPRLVFWNVCSRTHTIPVMENDMGVALVSGFSPNVAKMVMSGELDPYKAMLETLNDKRYDPIREALKE